MTSIRYRSKPVWHETGMHESGRPLLVAESPCNLLIRRKGTRQVLSLPWTMAYLRAATLEAARIRLEKINKRRSVKRGRVVSDK
jgi:hypothetical protein